MDIYWLNVTCSQFNLVSFKFWVNAKPLAWTLFIYTLPVEQVRTFLNGLLFFWKMTCLPFATLLGQSRFALLSRPLFPIIIVSLCHSEMLKMKVWIEIYLLYSMRCHDFLILPSWFSTFKWVILLLRVSIHQVLMPIGHNELFIVALL